MKENLQMHLSGSRLPHSDAYVQIHQLSENFIIVFVNSLMLFHFARLQYFHYLFISCQKSRLFPFLANEHVSLEQFLWIYICLSYCAITVKRHNNQGNSQKRKYLLGLLLTVLNGQSMMIMVGNRKVLQWNSNSELRILSAGGVQRERLGLA